MKMAGLIVVLALAGGAWAAEGVLEITKDTVLEAGKVYGAIVIKASNVKIDGNGAWVVGAKEGNPKTFKGVGISAKGVSNVVFKNVNAKGW